MLHDPLLIPPSPAFWQCAATALLKHAESIGIGGAKARNFSAIRVVVPDFFHAQQLRNALAKLLPHAFIPPRITTLQVWLALLPFEEGSITSVISRSERLMTLYAELRQHAWLKALFAARRNTDLLPLAHTLLTLFDELTQVLLPSMHLSLDAAEERWQAALQRLSLPARQILSDEAQLVWTLWKTQLDKNDAPAACFRRMMRLAEHAEDPLVWIEAVEPDAMESAFLKAYGDRQDVLPILLDWRYSALEPVYAVAWSEIVDSSSEEDVLQIMPARSVHTPGRVALCPTTSLEDEALCGAQTVIDWLQAGKSSIAIIAQDRVVARRIRALLERAKVYVSDETGWKLSTTRTAAAIAALLDVVATRAETAVLLDLLKSPFLFANMADRGKQVMVIESALRRANVSRGWEACIVALDHAPEAQGMLQKIAYQARFLTGEKTLTGWIVATRRALEKLDMHDALAADAAGVQVIDMLHGLERVCHASHEFSFAEWRAFISLHLESTPFIPTDLDRRVMMLQLNGARLRTFDAILLVGADARHLPSQSEETLFFANTVRHELGLATRETRQCMQLRDLTELLSAHPEVVLSWQAHKESEPNPVSPWVERLQLALECAGAPPLRLHQVHIPHCSLTPEPVAMPAPVAPHLVPRKLSASGYNSLVACPYQFFATRMLGLDGMDELSDMPEKRDYGDWLHRILTTYHETVRDRHIALPERETLLQEISRMVFNEALDRSAAALGYYVRWQKALPAYLAWANERESQGWHFAVGEQWFERVLPLKEGEITLYGRVDRIDHHESEGYAVLDYKAKNLQSLRDRLKEGEDHQLAFYGVLSGLQAMQGHYVALEPQKDRTGTADAQDYAEWQRILETRLTASMDAIANGASLRAMGINRICTYCDVRGLCRKGVW